MLLKYWKTIVITAIILYLSLAPASEFKDVPSFPNEDKLVHFLMYFGLAAVLLWDYASRKGLQVIYKRKTVWTVILTVAGFGVLIEICQGLLTATRSADIFDAIADTAGACAGYFVCRWLLPKFANMLKIKQ